MVAVGTNALGFIAFLDHYGIGVKPQPELGMISKVSRTYSTTI